MPFYEDRWDMDVSGEKKKILNTMYKQENTLNSSLGGMIDKNITGNGESLLHGVALIDSFTTGNESRI